MTDRELLEITAKIYGIPSEGYVEKFGQYDEYYDGKTEGIKFYVPLAGYAVWNPITDDGDALRLMHFIYRKTPVNHWARIYDNFWGGSLEDTRRAIVRAAAEIGKTMP